MENKLPEIPNSKNSHNPLSAKTRKILGVLGMSALSILPNDKLEGGVNSSNRGVGDDKNVKQAKYEYRNHELRNNESSRQKLALFLLKQTSAIKICRINIDLMKIKLSLLLEETNILIKKQNSNEQVSELDSVVLSHKQEEIKNYKKQIKELEKEIKKIENLIKKEKFSSEEIRSKVEEIIKMIGYYDTGREWVLDNFQSSEYKKKFEEETQEDFKLVSSLAHSDFSEKNFKKYIESKKKNIEAQIDNGNFFVSTDMEKSGGNSDTYSFYSYENRNVFFPIEPDSLKAITTAIHEYSHQITDGDFLISWKAVRYFSQAFDSLSVAANLSDENSSKEDLLRNIAYFSSPGEIYARKKEFEHDLERLGVKKYGEKFTNEHYLKARELQKKGKLSEGGSEFLFIIKQSWMERIMNEIADLGNSQKTNES